MKKRLWEADPIVYMAHPLGAPDRAGIEANLARAERWFKWLLVHFPEVGLAANWILWCRALDDLNPDDRARGLKFDDEEIRRVDAVWMVGGRISTGMDRGSKIAREADLPIVDLTELGDEPPAILNFGVRGIIRSAFDEAEVPVCYQLRHDCFTFLSPVG